MTFYDFLVLSPTEFECVSKDLLEKETGVNFEIFATGRDSGIDLRYSKNSAENIIVQCKRYTKYSDLISNLKKELDKVKKLNPKRYILTTSVSLSDGNKKDIKKLFEPYIRKQADIFGREQLNSSLCKHPDIENTHYKLWLSSTTVLNRIIHSKIYNQTEIALEEIKNNLEKYAENESFSEAVEILRQKHFVVIAGLPGVGKTTLARMMIYYLLGKKEFDEFVYLSGSIDDAYTIFNPEKKQIFMFDDFLGTNFLVQKIDRNEDSRLIDFIKKIHNSKNKAFILTTREYILKQAQIDYSLFESENFVNGKYIIDVSKYTSLVKAQILYNHFYAAKLPEKYINIFLEDKTYLRIINHDNYNPRLIELILTQKPWKNYSVQKFPEILTEYFDKPNSLWTHIYENEITEEAQIVLKVLLTTTSPIKLDNLILATQSYTNGIGKQRTRLQIEKALRELDGTFIGTQKSNKTREVIIDYQNPSIYDFLRDYYGESSRVNEFIDVIKHAIFLNQLTEVFATEIQPEIIPGVVRGKIVMNNELRRSIIDKIANDYEKLGWSAYIGNEYRDFGIAVYDEPSAITKMYKILYNLKLADQENIDKRVLIELKQYIAQPSKGTYDIKDALRILKRYKRKLTIIELRTFTDNIVQKLSNVEEVDTLEDLENKDREMFNLISSSPNYSSSIEEALIYEVESVDEEKLEDYVSEIRPILDKYGLDSVAVEEAVEERLYSMRQEAEASDFYENESPANWSPPTRQDDESVVIEKLFDSLRK